MDIQISAVVCTLNRICYLRKALLSLENQTLHKGKYEIIIVDNGSIDNTREIVHSEFRHLSNLRYFYEPIVGLSQARNTGWKNSEGEYVAYLDDDAVAAPNWLEKILETFDKTSPKPGGVGGKVDPIWEASRPAWLSDKLMNYLTILDWSSTPIILNKNLFVAGANMAFPKALLKVVGGFQLKLGRRGKQLLSNEEILLEYQIRDLGLTIYYNPEIFVEHHVHKSRLLKSWFIQRYYWAGVSQALMLLTHQDLAIWKRAYIGLIKVKQMLKLAFFFGLPYFVKPAGKKSRFELGCVILLRVGYVVGLVIG